MYPAAMTREASLACWYPSRVLSELCLDPLTPTFSLSFFSSELSPSAIDSSSTFSLPPSLASSSHAATPLPSAPRASAAAAAGCHAAPPAPARSTCTGCRAAKVRCDGDTPCTRCVRLHKAEHCRPAGTKRKRRDSEAAHSHRQSMESVEGSACVDHAALALIPRPFHSASVLEQLDPLGAFTSPLDGASVLPSARLSRLLVRQSLRSFHRGVHERPALGSSGRPLASIVSRWLAYARYASLLCPADLTSMLHGSAFINGVPVKHDDGSQALLRLHERSDAAADGHCTGAVCGGLCIGPRRLLQGKPLRFSFSSSPSSPLGDCEFNNHACLVFRHERSERLEQLERFVATEYAKDSQWGGGTCVEYEVVVRVNCAFERLFGWSQQQVRGLYQQHSFFALFQLFSPLDWPMLMGMEVAVELGTMGVEYEGSYQLHARGRHRTGSDFACYVHKSYERDSHGVVVKGYFTWLPIQPSEAAAADGID